MIATAGGDRVILYEGEGALPIPEAERFAILRSLLEQGYAVSRSRQCVWEPLAGGGLLLVLGRFPGQLPCFEEVAGEGSRLRFFNIEGRDPDAVVSLVRESGSGARAPELAGWKPWFPVIDYDRCTNCMQCLSFCLFDVYGVSEGKIRVQNQNNCKTDCPACSRVCPEVAILFPKYRSGPINGDEIDPEDLRREAMKVDISALLGGDIYTALRDRSMRARSRFAKERDENRALKERQQCLVRMGKQLEIPPEVLAALPSLDQILERVAQAAVTGTRDEPATRNGV